MIDSELCRLLLRRYGVAYREEPHLFGWGSLLAIRHGGYGRVPLLYGSGLRLTAPRALVEHFEERCAPERKLVPARQPLRTEVEADWRLYNGELAAETAVAAYFHLLPCREVMVEPFSRGIPAWEASVTRSWYPALRQLLTLLLRLNAGRAADALTRIRTTFDRTDLRLGDGRPFLTGDEVTLGDYALATAAAPLLLPHGCGAPMPAFEDMPATMQGVITDLRQHRTSSLVQRVYDASGE
jgi:glutathione S-transferase